jgi:hypothetical protein
MLEIGFAGLLLAHAGIHASFLAPRPPAQPGAPAWPFDATRSWLLSPLGINARTLRILGLALVGLTLAGYALAALGVVGLLPAAVTAPSVMVASLASLALLGVFFHPWLVVGVLIDIVLVWVALTR